MNLSLCRFLGEARCSRSHRACPRPRAAAGARQRNEPGTSRTTRTPPQGGARLFSDQIHLGAVGELLLADLVVQHVVSAQAALHTHGHGSGGIAVGSGPAAGAAAGAAPGWHGGHRWPSRALAAGPWEPTPHRWGLRASSRATSSVPLLRRVPQV